MNSVLSGSPLSSTRGPPKTVEYIFFKFPEPKNWMNWALGNDSNGCKLNGKVKCVKVNLKITTNSIELASCQVGLGDGLHAANGFGFTKKSSCEHLTAAFTDCSWKKISETDPKDLVFRGSNWVEKFTPQTFQ